MSEAILSEILGELKNIKVDINVLKQDVNILKEDTTSLKQEMGIANQRLANLEEKVDNIVTQQEEYHLILRALEHRTEVSKAERENHDLKIVKLEGRTTALENKQIAVANILKEA